MAFGIYIHIPYCLQRCHYCDFTTFEVNKTWPSSDYISVLLKEIELRQALTSTRHLDTIYFGGGTPSLLTSSEIARILQEIRRYFHIKPQAEITLEVNPATLDSEKLKVYKEEGVNRLSVGVQSFQDPLLKICGRKHSAQDSRNTLEEIQKQGFDFSLDLLFALPKQSLKDIKADVKEALHFHPPHISTYYLTVPEGHSMNQGRAPEGEQAEMFEIISQGLQSQGLHKYEISNFAQKGKESRHNLIYWEDQAYLGLGVSAHSYLPQEKPYGLRFWNPKTLTAYKKQVETKTLLPPESQREHLEEYEALTDFCHMSFRTLHLNKEKFIHKFSQSLYKLTEKRLKSLAQKNLVNFQNPKWHLTNKGQMWVNEVLRDLTFLKEELKNKTQSSSTSVINS